MAPGSQSALRGANQRRVLNAVRAAGSLTQAEIARVTGLSAATVSNIVRELRTGGTVLVTPTSSGGRRAQSVSLAHGAGLVVGTELGPAHISVVVCDQVDRVLAEERIPYDATQSPERGLRRAEWLITTVLKQARADRGRVRGVGVAVAGPVEGASGQIAPGCFLSWAGVDVGAELTERLHLPVHVTNDANAGALGEMTQGAGRGHRDFAYVGVSSGVGCGLVLGGEVYTGPGGFAGEIGHITVDEQGRICHCGNRGCLQTVVGAPYLLDLLPGQGRGSPVSSRGSTPTLETLVSAAVAGELGPRRVIADAGRAIGAAAAIACNLLNPPLLIIGGELAEAGELLLDPIKEVLGRHALPSAVAKMSVVTAELGVRAQLLGAVAHARRSDAAVLGEASSQ